MSIYTWKTRRNQPIELVDKNGQKNVWSVANPKPWLYCAAQNGHTIYEGPIPYYVHMARTSAIEHNDEEYDDEYGYWDDYLDGGGEVAGVCYDEYGNVVDPDADEYTTIK